MAPHVAMLAFPFGTHAAPLYSLARSLAAAAPGAVFSFLNSARSNAALARAFSGSAPPNLRSYDVDDGGSAVAAAGPEEEVGLFLGVSPENFEAALEMAVEGREKVSCLVSDAFLWFARAMAEKMGAPWVTLWTGGPVSLVAHLYTDELRRTNGIGEPDGHLDFIPYMSPLRVQDLPEGVVSGNLESVFARMLHRMADELPNAAAVALNTFRGLDPDLDHEFESKFKRALYVGPLNLLVPQPAGQDDHNCVPWLDSQEPATVAYISFGTLICPPPMELAELAAGLEASGAPFLWSLKDGAREHLPAGFLDRTKDRGVVVPWAPQVLVLGHKAAGVFVTHCGWNSVMESVTAGVPMLCRPFLGDQRLNAGVVSHVWRIGAGFEAGVVTRDAMSTALSSVLQGEEGKRMRARIRDIREKATLAVAPQGGSTHDFTSLLEIVSGCYIREKATLAVAPEGGSTHDFISQLEIVSGC
nr:UDP-glycosyltransferase [Paris polyphylla]